MFSVKNTYELIVSPFFFFFLIATFEVHVMGRIVLPTKMCMLKYQLLVPQHVTVFGDKNIKK